MDLNILNLDFSPIKGPEGGNIEYLIYMTKDKEINSDFKDDYVDYIVNKAHNNLNGDK